MNLPALGWEIFYADGNRLSSRNHEWKDVPGDNVVVVVIWHDYHIPGVRQKTMLVGSDYYYYEDENNWGTSNKHSEIKNKKFKRGIWVTDGQFDEIYREAFEKLDF